MYPTVFWASAVAYWETGEGCYTFLTYRIDSIDLLLGRLADRGDL